MAILFISNYLPKKVILRKIGIVEFEILVLAIYVRRTRLEFVPTPVLEFPYKYSAHI